MDARTWLGLEPTHNPMRWVLPVTPAISTVGPFLFGGCGLGAAIAAMEATSGRPVVWATAQYLSYAIPPSVLDIDVTIAAQGRSVTQARVVGHVADTEILTVNAALGTRDMEPEGAWVVRPDVPARTTARCGGPPARHRVDHGPHRRAAGRRLAVGGDGRQPRPDGRSLLWARMPDLLDPSSGASLTILGDYVPFGISQASAGRRRQQPGQHARGVPPGADRVGAARHPDPRWPTASATGSCLWSEDGSLLATASQSTIVRMMPPEMLEEMAPARRREHA